MSSNKWEEVDDQDWKNLVQTHLKFLFTDYGFSIIENIYNQEIYGNRLTTLESDKFIIRIEVDRRILGIYIISKEHPSFKSILEILIGYLNARPTSDYLDHSGSDEDQLSKKSSLFRKYASDIFAFGESDNIQEHVAHLEQYVQKQAEIRKGN